MTQYTGDMRMGGRWIAVKESGDEWWFGGTGCAQIVIRPADSPSCNSIAVMGCSDGDDPEADRIARLIAAAPDLLEALQEVVRITHEAGTGNLMGRQINKVAFDAIARATGATAPANPKDMEHG